MRHRGSCQSYACYNQSESVINSGLNSIVKGRYCIKNITSNLWYKLITPIAPMRTSLSQIALIIPIKNYSRLYYVHNNEVLPQLKLDICSSWALDHHWPSSGAVTSEECQWWHTQSSFSSNGNFACGIIYWCNIYE